MSESHTFPSAMARVPVRAIHLEVTAGPDQGLRHEAQGERVSVGSVAGNDLVLHDPTVSRYHLELEREHERLLLRDLGSTNGTRIGAVELQGQAAFVQAGATLQLGATQLRLDDGKMLLVEYGLDEVLGGMRGRCPAMKKLMTQVTRLAQRDVAVLIQGETGSGKELVARALHDASPRARRPFVIVDCGAVAPTLFTSELFGHERGAFTGAEAQRRGAFELAQGGTLFLDEVGELPGELQRALLGVLERRVVRRLGGREEIPVDVRVIAATNRDLRSEVNAGSFRLDLFHRLAAVLLAVPPLRARGEDIPLLIEHFLREAGHEGALEEVFSARDLAALQAHAWPGNVRELRNLVEARLAVGPELTLPSSSTRPARPPQGEDLIDSVLALRYRDARAAVLGAFEQRYLKNLLATCGGSVRHAARVARMDRSYLIDLLQRHRLR